MMGLWTPPQEYWQAIAKGLFVRTMSARKGARAFQAPAWAEHRQAGRQSPG